ncbi:Alpha/beta hydrolase family protein [Rubripirellula lacrimiformis]|uniref:Alpha/beta hydrolase family protein n=1 Tax=Rubripirellula lacrimiformis TaxID=1930273 RepID=A0A517NG44_9BACT|nr:alpha/beta hydrolase [Rubripirellula lacrimiformis]QDT06105.1 Alpha/beta hydrolase family protein [Rubripirellula lacrimiformis]
MRSVAAIRTMDDIQARRHQLLLGLLFLFAFVFSSAALAQKPKAKEDPKLKPRPVTLKTKDGITLRAFYFPSDKGKEAVTVMVVHEWQGQASPYLKLVMALKNAGCAVLVPDYRGHGGSKEYNYRGKTKTFNVAQMSKRDIESIILMDLETSKGFLKEENDAGNLNMNALVVVGIREGCVMATHWAARDWSFPSVGSNKQGQDVKGLVLISPEKQIKSIALDQALMSPTILQLPIMVVAGKESPEGSEAQRIIKRVEGVKRRAGGGTVTGFEGKMVDTALSGHSLVNDVSEVIPDIVQFITSEVNATEGNPWIQRN